ncbi:thioredoxin family protein [Bacteroidota bacterium]
MKLKITLFFICLSFTIYAQDWQINMDTAANIAKEHNKKIVLVFQGSDWCAPCIKLDKKIWSTELFKNYAKDNFVMVKADFPRRKKNKLSEELTKQNGLLFEKYNRNGIFPFVVVLDADKKVLKTTGYKQKMNVREYIDHLNN